MWRKDARIRCKTWLWHFFATFACTVYAHHLHMKEEENHHERSLEQRRREKKLFKATLLGWIKVHLPWALDIEWLDISQAKSALSKKELVCFWSKLILKYFESKLSEIKRWRIRTCDWFWRIFAYWNSFAKKFCFWLEGFGLVRTMMNCG